MIYYEFYFLYFKIIYFKFSHFAFLFVYNKIDFLVQYHI